MTSIRPAGPGSAASDAATNLSPRAVGPTGSGTPQMLLELISNTADPGYAAAAARRDGVPNAAWYEQPLAALGAALVGLLLVVAYLHTHRAAPQTAKLHDDLVARVHAAEQANAQLEASILSDQAAVSALRDEALPKAGELSSLLRREQLVAGSVAAYGPGLQVRLASATKSTATPAPRAGVTTVGDTSVLTDKDVRSVVNELWADGAEAISVNDVRLTPVSAIRFAGQAVLVDFQPVTSPYLIRAIGDSDVLETSFADSDVASRYHTLAAVSGIGFSWSAQSKLMLSAAPVPRPNYANVPTPTPLVTPTPAVTPSAAARSSASASSSAGPR